MDRMIYIAMSGAQQTLAKQAVVANNLANVNSAGYRAEAASFQAYQMGKEDGAKVGKDNLPTRAFVTSAASATDFSSGGLMQTGRDLDVAIQGKGWIAVQTSNGAEAYTRNGGLQVGANGQLQTISGQIVLGDGGPIEIPANAQVIIAKDGTISTVPAGSQPNAVAVLGRIKLVNPPEADLRRGDDGLFRMQAGGVAEADAGVLLVPGAVEGSNVNMVGAMVDLISLSRQFETQMELLQNSKSNAQQASRLLSRA